jgi:hypothetical protein
VQKEQGARAGVVDCAFSVDKDDIGTVESSLVQPPFAVVMLTHDGQARHPGDGGAQ